METKETNCVGCVDLLRFGILKERNIYNIDNKVVVARKKACVGCVGLVPITFYITGNSEGINFLFFST